MWPFRRRPKGRHALGAAVTSIPSGRPSVPELIERTVTAPPPAPVVVGEPEPVAPEPVVVAAQVLRPEPVPGIRVELGFRDGSTAALAPGSEQAKALTDIASVLTRRD
jgi:hypothetical protein